MAIFGKFTAARILRSLLRPIYTARCSGLRLYLRYSRARNHLRPFDLRRVRRRVRLHVPRIPTISATLPQCLWATSRRL